MRTKLVLEATSSALFDFLVAAPIAEASAVYAQIVGEAVLGALMTGRLSLREQIQLQLGHISAAATPPLSSEAPFLLWEGDDALFPVDVMATSASPIRLPSEEDDD